jgi:hypothetical protein
MVLSSHEHKGNTNNNDDTKWSWNETNLKTTKQLTSHKTFVKTKSTVNETRAMKLFMLLFLKAMQI